MLDGTLDRNEIYEGYGKLIDELLQREKKNLRKLAKQMYADLGGELKEEWNEDEDEDEKMLDSAPAKAENVANAEVEKDSKQKSPIVEGNSTQNLLPNGVDEKKEEVHKPDVEMGNTSTTAVEDTKMDVESTAKEITATKEPDTKMEDVPDHSDTTETSKRAALTGQGEPSSADGSSSKKDVDTEMKDASPSPPPSPKQPVEQEAKDATMDSKDKKKDTAMESNIDVKKVPGSSIVKGGEEAGNEKETQVTETALENPKEGNAAAQAETVSEQKASTQEEGRDAKKPEATTSHQTSIESLPHPPTVPKQIRTASPAPTSAPLPTTPAPATANRQPYESDSDSDFDSGAQPVLSALARSLLNGQPDPEADGAFLRASASAARRASPPPPPPPGGNTPGTPAPAGPSTAAGMSAGSPSQARGLRAFEREARRGSLSGESYEPRRPMRASLGGGPVRPARREGEDGEGGSGSGSGSGESG